MFDSMKHMCYIMGWGGGVGGAVDAESKLSSLFEFLSGMKRMGSVFVQPCDCYSSEKLSWLPEEPDVLVRCLS